VTRAPRAHRADLPVYLVCLLAGIVCNMFSGNSKLLGFPIGPDRLFIAAGLVLLILDQQPWLKVKLRLRPVHVFSILIIGLALWSAVDHHTLTTSLGFYALLDRLVVPFVFFVVAPVVFSTPGRRDLLLKTLVIVGIYLGVTAFFEVAGPHSLVFPRFILDPNVGIQVGRARGPFTESEADGLVMCQCAFVAAVVVSAARFSRRWRVVAAFACLACGLGMLLTLTRSIWIGSVLGVIVVCALTAGLRRYLLPFLAVLALGVVVALATIPGLHEQASARAETTRSLWDRENTDQAALRVIDQHPLTGVGWLRFIDVNQDYVRQARGYPITNINIEVHNVVLSRAAELGIPGGALWVLAVLFGPCLVFIRRAPPGDLAGWRIASLGGTACWLVTIMLSPVPYPMPNMLVWLEAGIALTPYLTRSFGSQRLTSGQESTRRFETAGASA
jgi:putative inorganic carbon (HCO3(-)) transporter